MKVTIEVRTLLILLYGITDMIRLKPDVALHPQFSDAIRSVWDRVIDPKEAK